MMPLIAVLSLTALKDIYEDYFRFFFAFLFPDASIFFIGFDHLMFNVLMSFQP